MTAHTAHTYLLLPVEHPSELIIRFASNPAAGLRHHTALGEPERLHLGHSGSATMPCRSIRSGGARAWCNTMYMALVYLKICAARRAALRDPTLCHKAINARYKLTSEGISLPRQPEYRCANPGLQATRTVVGALPTCTPQRPTKSVLGYANRELTAYTPDNNPSC